MAEQQGFEQGQEMGIAREFLVFLMENKLWWMIPIVLILLLLVGVVLLGQNSAIAPFIYPIF